MSEQTNECASACKFSHAHALRGIFSSYVTNRTALWRSGCPFGERKEETFTRFSSYDVGKLVEVKDDKLIVDGIPETIRSWSEAKPADCKGYIASIEYTDQFRSTVKLVGGGEFVNPTFNEELLLKMPLKTRRDLNIWNEEFQRLERIPTFEGELYKGGCTVEDLQSWLDSPTLKAVVTSHHQCFVHPKVVTLPLGIDWAVTRILLKMLSSRDEVCSSTRIQWLMINFSEWGHRKQIAEKILSKFPHLSNMYGKGQNGRKIPQSQGGTSESQFHYFTQMRCSRFVLCPPGLGWDSYRLWESLSLGAIPIVEDSPGWTRVINDLPVLIVRSFEDVTPQLLETEYE